MSELFPCPNPLCSKSHPFPAPFNVLCLTCGTSGAIHVDRKKARAAWNALPRTVQAAQSDLGDWRIDTHSTGNPILTYQNCSVIQDEQAFEVLALLRAKEVPSDRERQYMEALAAYALEQGEKE